VDNGSICKVVKCTVMVSYIVTAVALSKKVVSQSDVI